MLRSGPSSLPTGTAGLFVQSHVGGLCAANDDGHAAEESDACDQPDGFTKAPVLEPFDQVVHALSPVFGNIYGNAKCFLCQGSLSFDLLLYSIITVLSIAREKQKEYTRSGKY